ncbi:MAG: hypothetical protein ACYTEU_11600 [Planctomycetota bacterium]
MTTDGQKKKTCSNSQLSWKFSLIAFLVAFVYILARNIYYASLTINSVASFFMYTGLAISTICGITGFFLGFLALFRIALKKLKQKGIAFALLGIFLSFLTFAIIMPTRGIGDQFIYLIKTNKQVLRFLNEISNNGTQIENSVFHYYYIDDMEEHINEEIPFVRLRFELRYEHDNLDLPECFEASIYEGLDRVECKVVDSIEE